MKKLVLLLVYLILPFALISQESVNFTEDIHPGVYRTFSEFKANRPSYTGYLKISADSLSVIHVSESGSEKKAGNNIWGYSDGKRFFILYKGLNELVKVGSLSVFEAGVLRETGNDFIVDYKTGEIIKASEVNILKLFSADRDLYYDFKRNGGKELVYIYADKYNQKHPVDYPGITEEEALAANTRFDQFSDDNIYFELFGSSVMWGSFNYEKKSAHKGIFYLMNRFGIGYGYIEQVHVISFPVGINTLFQFSNNFAAEAGVGVSVDLVIDPYKLDYGSGHGYNITLDPLLTGFFGIRFQYPNGFMARAGFCPIFDFKKDDPILAHEFTPWFGVSAGYSFR